MDGSSVLKFGAVGVGAYLIYRYFFETPAATPAATSTASSTAATTATPAATTPTPAPSTQPAFSSLDQTYAKLLAALKSANDPAVTNGDTAAFSVLNFYLSYAEPTLTGLPEYSTIFGSADTGTPMTAATYWAAIAPWLKANKGLSGLGVFAGLGALARRMR